MKGIIFGCAVPHPPIMIPEIGQGREDEIASTIRSMNFLNKKLSELHPDILVVISPHGVVLNDAMGIATADYCKGNLDTWGPRDIDFLFKNDLQFVTYLKEESKEANIPLRSIGESSYNLDHGVLVPIYYLAEGIRDIALVPLTFSFLSLDTHYRFGQLIKRAAERTQKRIALIASGDLSHRLLPGAPAGYDPIGKIFDERVVNAMSQLDYDTLLSIDPEITQRAGECGLRSFIILLGALSEYTITPQILSYEGPFGVGYMVASFEVLSSRKEE